MTPERLMATGIAPGLAELALHGIPDSVLARRFLLAIALQESSLRHRRQLVSGGEENGPAVSFWQFEKMGGCLGVLSHDSTAKRMTRICMDYNVAATPGGLWEAMRYNDVVAAIAARLLVYTLPSALPATEQDGWAQYIKAWRPGKPHQKTWPANWHAASTAVGLKP